jgi:hypothetical protein
VGNSPWDPTSSEVSSQRIVAADEPAGELQPRLLVCDFQRVEDCRDASVDIWSLVKVVATVLQLRASAFVGLQLAHHEDRALRFHDHKFFLNLCQFRAFGGEFRGCIAAVPE